MYERFVFLKLKDEYATPQGLEELIAKAEEVLPNLPGVLGCRAGLPGWEDAAKGWDLCLVLNFASAEDIHAYFDHPDHLGFLKEVMGPRVEARRVWNFSMKELPPRQG